MAPTTTTNISNFNTHVFESMGTWAGSTTATGVTSWDFRGTGTRGGAFNGTNLASGTSGGWYGDGNIAFLGSSSASAGNATLRLQNVTGSAIAAFRLVYKGQMWKSGSASPTVSVSWSKNSSSSIPAAGALTALSSLGFSDATSSISSGVTFAQSVTSASIANNDYVFLRWIHAGGSNSDILSWDDVTFIPQPITQVSAISFSSVGTTSMTVSWTAGNGRRRAVFMKATSAGTITNPSDGTLYTASSTFGSGTQLGTSGYYCIYNGTGTSVNVTGLAASTTYYVQAFEYNSDATPTAITTTYLTTAATGNQATATPCVVPTVYTVTGTGSYCAGGSGIEIRLSNSQTGINYQVYNGSATVGSAIAGTGASPFSLGTFTAAGTYTVLATNTTGGCTSNMSGSAAVSIDPLPTVGVSPSTASSCSSITATGADSYEWSPATGLSATTGATVAASPTVATTYTVTGTDANGCINTATVSVMPATVSITGTSPAAASAPQGTANQLLHTFTLGVSGADATLSGLTLSTFGSYTATDVDNIKCWYSTSATFNAATATLLSTLSSPGVAGAKIFPSFSPQIIGSGVTGYVHITAEIGGSATGGNTVGIAATNLSGFTICAASLTGTDPVPASNLQTITASPCSGTPAAGTVMPASSFFCGSGSATLNLTGGATGSGLTYQWSSSSTNTPPGTAISGATNESYNASSVTSTTYYWCTTTCGAASNISAVAVISVNAVPSLSGATSSSPVCTGGTLSLFANSPSDVATYAWDGPSGFTSSLQNPTISSVSASAAGTYTVTVNNGSGTGCSQTYTVDATVNDAPSSSGITVSGTLCVGGTTTLNANSSDATSWNWSGPDGFTSTLTNPAITPSATGTYSLSLSNGGGSGCTPATIYTTSVTVFAVPTSAGATNSGPVCAGASVTLSANSTGATSWLWSGPSGYTSTVQNPAFSISGSGTYSLTVSRSGDGCSPSTIYTTSVTVNALPTLTVTPTTGMAGSTFTASGAATYVWSPAAGLSATTGSSVTATPSSATTYTVTGTSLAGCIGTATINVLPASGNLVWNYTALSPQAASSSNPAVVTASSCTATIGNSFGTVSSAIGTTSASSGYSGATGGGNIGNAVALGAFSTSSAYINYLLTPNSGYCLTVTGVSFGTRSTGTGPQGYTITSDVAGFGSTVLASGTIPNTSTWTLASPSFTDVTGAPNTAVNVRIYGHSGSGSPSSGTITWRMDDVTFTYSVSPSPSLTNASNNAPVCTGSTLNLFANSPENVASYSWVGPNSFTSTEQNPSISSVSMAAQGTYTVTVNNGSGCTKVYTTVVGLNATPSSTGPTNSSPVCAGSGVAFTANSSNANQWSWTGPSGFTSTLQNPTLPSASAGSYSLTLNNTVTGCSSSTVFSTIVTVNPIPVSTGATTDGVNCAGEHTTIRANSTYANRWSWSGPSGFTSSDENPSVSPSSSATYSVTLSNTLTGCSSSVVYTTSVSVNPAPTAAPTNNGPICFGGVIALSANSTLAASWSWTGPDGYTSSLQNPTLSPTVTGVYSLTVASGICSPATIYTTSVTVNTTPTAAPSNSGPICVGGTATLSANPAGGATTYAWSGPSGYTSTEANPVMSPTTTSTYSLTVTNGTTDAGCSPTTIYTTTVTVRPTPTAAPTNNGYICNGGTVSLTANGAGGASVYNWNGTSLSSSSIANPTATPTATTVYSLTVSDGTADAGCSPATVYTTSVTVNATPTAAPSNSGPICEGGTVNLSANAAGGATVYNWSGAALSSTTIDNPTATPTVTGIYSLSVSDGSGQPGCSPSIIYTTSVTVNTTPTAAPSNSGPICVGGTATLSANPAGGATTYAWSGPSGYTSTEANPAVSPTTTSTYSLTVSNGTTDEGCSPTTIYTTTVTVRPTPIAAPTNNGYICNGGTVSLTANGAGGASVYNWSGLALSSSSVANPTATPTVTGVYSLTVSDGTADAGCSPATVYTTSVAVNATPIAAPTNSGPICVGGTVNLTANGAGGASVYNWSGVSLSSSSIANPTATPTVTGVYSLTVSDGSGQPGCAPAAVYTTSVTVNTTPTAAPSNSGPICVGGTATLSANPAGGATTYAWSSPSGYTSTEANPVVSPTTTGTYSLTVTNGTTDAGCSPTTIYTTTVTVRPTPTAAPTNNGYICNGGTVSLTANGAGATVYNWSGLALSSSSIANPTATPTVSGVYSLTVSDGTTDAGCSPSTIYTTSVTVNATPTAAPSNSGPICVGGTVNLSANAAGGATVYSWSGAALSSTTIDNPTATPTVTGIYSLTVSDGSSQPGCSPATIYTTSVTVNTTPTAAPSNSGPICVGGTATLSANPAGGATTYAWSGPSGYTSTEANPVVSPTTTGTYSLTVTNGTTDAGCSPTTIYTTTLTVRPTPTAAPTNNGYICNGGTVSLTASGAGGASVYNWSGLALSSSSVANPTATPTATTVYSLTVSDGTTDAGCSPSTIYTTSVTVNATPTAAPSNSGPICVGGTVNLTANGAGGATVYNWSGAALSSSTIANPTATPTVTGVYSLTVSDGSSQPGCSPSIIYTTSVTVNTTPTAAPSNSGPICVGGTATLSANPAGGATTYAWSGPMGYTSTEANPVVSPTTTSTYSLTVTNGTTDAGCSPTTIYTTTVTVRPTPTAAPANNGYICNGGTVSLTANGAGGASVYIWSGLALSSSSIANPTATPTVSGVYSLTVSDGTADAGCSPSTVYTTSVTVNATPTAAPSNSGPICVGGTVNLTANGADGATVYNWSGSALSSSTIANPTATPTVTGVYSLTVSDGSSQPGCSPATIYTTSVTVNTTPTAAPTNSGPICVGGTATLSANPAGGATTYAWSGPLDYTSTEANPVVSPTITGTYSLTVTNGTTDAGCSPTTIYTTTVTVRPTPTAAPTNNGYICNGGTVSLTANGAGGASVYNWSGTSLSSSSIANPTATPTATTIYSLMVSDGTADAGCSPATVYTTAVTVNATPTAAPTNSGPICVGGTVNLSANTTGGATVYYWSGAALSSSTIANPTATPTVTGVYSLTVSDGSSQPGCSPSIIYTTSVTVNTTPIAAPSNSGPICVGGTATLSANPAGGATTYAWSGPSGYTSTEANPVVSPTTTSTYSLTVSNGTTDAGCSPTTIYTTTVTVRPTPIAAPTNNGYICNGGTVSLTANGAGGASVYNWSGLALSSSSIANPTATPTATTVYSLTVSDGTADAGCSPATVYTTSVTVNATPTAAPANSGPICVGGTVNLSANGADGATIYNWSGVSLSSTTLANPTATPTVTGVYSLTVSDGSGQPGCSPSIIYTTSVTVIELPVAGSVTGIASVCAGSSTILSNSVPDGTWSSESETIATVGATGIVNGVSAGTATISYTVTNSCGSATAVQVVTVNPLPVAGVIIGDTAVCLGATTILSSTISGGSWTSADVSIASVGTSGMVTGIGAGSTNISYTVSNGCGSATVTQAITVNVIPPAGTITGVGSVCAGETIMLSNVVSGGEWFSSNTTVATIETTGVVSGLMAGTSTVSYTVTGICGSATTTKVITVNVIPVVATITGTLSPICPGTTTTFANTTVGGTWSSSQPSVAVVNVAGVITGITPGTSTITYTAGNICGATFATKEVTVNPAPPTVSISGPISVTLGSTIDLIGTPSGGVWSSLSPSMATVSAAGVVTGVSASVGTTVITYAASNYCGTRTATRLILVNAVTGSDILGTYSVCVGKTTNLSNLVPGGTWTSSNNSVATVSSTGVVSGANAGTVTILYIKATTISAAVITVNPLPAAITGPATVCAGSGITLTSSEGGSWNSSNPLAATVDAAGVVAGIAPGTPIITYQTTFGCIATKIMSVHALPANPSGLTSVCEGSSVTFTNSASGTWSSSNTDIATVLVTPGMITGISAGVATISFRAASTGCYSSKTITVKPLPSAITGSTNVCVGSSGAYICTTSGGVWSKTSVPAAALSINTSGVASGYTSGTAIITYAVDGCIATRPVTVSPLPGTISATSATLCIGSSVTLSSPVPGGTWTSGNETVATVSSGTVSGNSAGTATISYTSAAGCYSVYTVTVNTPPTVTASGTTCVGSNTILTSSVSGTWSVANSSIATISASGLVNGVSAGTTTVTFRTSATCFTTGVFTVTPAPDPIAGPDKVCIGSDIVLTHGSAGGTWSSSAPSKGSIGTDGTLRGLSAGSTTVTYVTTSGCITTALISVNAVPNPISGGAILCEGNTTVLSNSTPSGTWTSDGVAASVVAGTVTGITSGTSAITYTVPSTGCMTTRIVTVQPNPSITAASAGICVGETTTLTATPAGGSWTSGNTTIATIGLYTGVVTGSGTGGVTTVTYSLPTGCRSSTTVNVLPKPTVVSGGTSSFCAGTFIDLVAGETGITWTSSDISVADVATATPLVGRVVGYTLGTTTISYANAAGCGRSLVVTVTAAPSSISGIDEICVGCVASVSNVTTGGTWSTSNSSRAIIVSTTGLLTGMSAGTVTVSYRTSPTCYVTKVVTVVAPSPIAIDGPNGVCVASSATYTHATTGGTWGVSLSGFATINTGTGLVTGVAQGTAVITYFISPGNYVTKSITVYPFVFPISGTYSVCVGASTTLTSAQTGGTWSVSNTAIGTISNLTGVLNGLSEGTATVTYTNPYTGCYSLRTVTVHPLPAAISGASTLCVGSDITLTSATTGGTWYTSAGIYATVNASSGVVTGIAASPVTINYISDKGCITTKNLTVNPLPAPITGSATLGTVTGTTTTLSSLPSTGTWSSSDASVATIGLTSGVISSVGIGTSVITYTLPGTGCYRTRVQTVVAGRPGEVNRNMNVDDHVSIYPSPTSGTIHLNTEVGGELMVLSLDGKVVATYHAMAGAQSFTFASDIAAGVYVCRFVAADGNIYQTKIVYQP